MTKIVYLPDMTNVTAPDNVSDEEVLAWAKKQFPDAFVFQQPVAKPVEDNSSDFMRGIAAYLPQTKGLLGAGKAAIGVAAQKIFGKGDFTDSMIESGLQTMSAADKEQAAKAKDTDTFEGAWNKGIWSVITDYVPYMLGQGAANIGESVAAAGIGSIIGGMAGSVVPGAGTSAGAIGGAMAGVVDKELIKAGVKTIAKNIAEKEGAEAAAAYTAKETAKALSKIKGREVGEIAGIAAQAGFHGVTEVGQRAFSEAEKAGTDVRDVDFARLVPSMAVHAGADYLATRIGLGSLKATPKEGQRLLTAISENIIKTGAKSVPAELLQTATERFGANLSLADMDAAKEYMETAVASFIQPGVGATIGGVRSYAASKNIQKPKPLDAQLDDVAQQYEEKGLNATEAYHRAAAFIDSNAPVGEEITVHNSLGRAFDASVVGKTDDGRSIIRVDADDPTKTFVVGEEYTIANPANERYGVPVAEGQFIQPREMSNEQLSQEVAKYDQLVDQHEQEFAKTGVETPQQRLDKKIYTALTTEDIYRENNAELFQPEKNKPKEQAKESRAPQQKPVQVEEPAKTPDLKAFAEQIRQMPQEEIDDLEPSNAPGGARAYELYEAQKLLKNPSDKLKKVTDDNSLSLWQEYSHIANVDGEHYGISNEYEDPDTEEPVFAYKNLSDTSTKLIEPHIEAKRENIPELIDFIRNNKGMESRAPKAKAKPKVEKYAAYQPAQERIGKMREQQIQQMYDKALPRVAKLVEDRMTQLGIGKYVKKKLAVSLESKAGEANGVYMKKLIALAVSGKSDKQIMSTLNHESIHAMKELGMITDEEWANLKALVDKKGWLGTFRINERYPELTQEEQYEEVIADAFATYVTGRSPILYYSDTSNLPVYVYKKDLKLAGQPVGIINRILKTLRIIKNAAEEDAVFKRLETPVEPKQKTAKKSAKPSEKTKFSLALKKGNIVKDGDVYVYQSPLPQSFHDFFGDSTIKRKGRPIIGFHGTAQDIHAFKTKQANAVFVTFNPRFAEDFAYSSESWMEQNWQTVIPKELHNEVMQDAKNLVKKDLNLSKFEKKLQKRILLELDSAIKEGFGLSEEAWDYAMQAVKKYMPSGGNIIPVFVKAESPFDYENTTDVERIIDKLQELEPNRTITPEFRRRISAGDWEIIENTGVRKAIQDLGHDSFYVFEGGNKNLAVFDSSQLKSAIGNNGEYDPAESDIKRSVAPRLPENEGEQSTAQPIRGRDRVPGEDFFRDPLEQFLVIDGNDIRAIPSHLRSVVNAISTYNAFPVSNDPDETIRNMHKTIVDNLIWLYDLMPENLRARAKLWYDGANRIANDVSQKYGYTVQQTAGVYAVLSPQKDWFMNVSLGDRVMSIFHERQNERTTLAMKAWVDSYINASKTKEEREKRIAFANEFALLGNKQLKDMSDKQAAIFVRVFDETYNPREYRIVTPEGGFLGFVTKNESDEADTNSDEVPEGHVAWGDFNTIQKAISVLRDGSKANISANLGKEHKVRNFYNNILVPGSRAGHVTIDTHAVAAAFFKALSGASLEVANNFGGKPKGKQDDLEAITVPGPGGSKVTGASGTYGFIADAYRDAAAQIAKRDKIDLLPREMQSITWEAIRSIFPAAWKKKHAPLIEAIYNRAKAGEITLQQARDETRRLAEETKDSKRLLDTFAWEGETAGKFVSEGGFSFDQNIDPVVSKRKARLLDPVVIKDKIIVNISAATTSEQLPGVAEIYKDARAGSLAARVLLQNYAADNLNYLLSDIGNTKAVIKKSFGLYDTNTEPSIRLTVSFPEEEKEKVLAVLNKFSTNFNQERFDVREKTKEKVGKVFDDGSYATQVIHIKLKSALDDSSIQELIDISGLAGLSFGSDFIEAYYSAENLEKASDLNEYQKFNESTRRITELLGQNVARIDHEVQRLWPYGDVGRGYGVTVERRNLGSYVPSNAEVSPEIVKQVSQYLYNKNRVKLPKDQQALVPSKLKLFTQEPELTEKQSALQSMIARFTDLLPDNDLKNKLVFKAYDRLAKELVSQYKALPVKVEVLAQDEGEKPVDPYGNKSENMRKDIQANNHLYIYPTTKQSFGPENEDFSKHPLFQQSGLKDINGYPLRYNDLLRAVHDYFAHAITGATFGERGEEAAWKNHMAMTLDPLARWALTMETRSQNSWVNFRENLDRSIPRKDRQYAPQKAALLPVEFALTGSASVDKPMKAFIDSLKPSQRAGSKPKDQASFNRLMQEHRQKKANNEYPKYSVAPKLSTTRIMGSNQADYTPRQLAAMKNVGLLVEEPTIQERVQNQLKNLGPRIKQGLFDAFDPIKTVDPLGYLLARMSKGSSGAFEAFLKYGKLKIRGGVYDADNSGGFIEKVAAPMQGEFNRFLSWVAAKRAETLSRQDRENLFTQNDIKVLKTLDQGMLKFEYTMSNGQKTRSRADMFKDTEIKYNEFNKNILDIAEKQGLIDADTRKIWEKMTHVPFFRVSEEKNGFIGEDIKQGLVRQAAAKKLKGGTNKLNADLLSNVLHNWHHLIDASIKNAAAIRILNTAALGGKAISASENTIRQMGKSIDHRSGVVWAMENGKKRFFLVEDPALVEALSSMQPAEISGFMMKGLNKFKNYLTFGVTVSPYFKVRNLIRDSVQAVATADLSYNIGKNFVQGVKATDRKGQDYISMLASGAIIRFGSLEGTEAERVRRIVRSGVKDSTILDSDSKWQPLLDKLHSAWSVYEEVGNRGEEINRAALYKQLSEKYVAQGMSRDEAHAQASLMARDLMDFSMQGSWPIIRGLTQVVPFMNARLQGLYKLGRSTNEDKARIWIVIGAASVLSVALMMMFKDDDDWKKRTDADRNGFWWFKFGGIAYRIPKPFEVGAVASLAEHGWDLFFGNEMTGKRFADNMGKLLLDNLAMNPIPQVFKPMMEVYFNKSLYSGTPIETMGMEKLLPEYRFTSKTSEFAKGLSTVGMGFLSPVQIDYLLQGYFAWLGTFVTGTADVLVNMATSGPAKPSIDILSKVTGNMASTLPAPQSRYVNSMYEQAKELEQLYGTQQELLRRRDIQAYREFTKENQKKLQQYRMVETVKKQESMLNARIRMIENDPAIKDGDVKKEMIQRIQNQRDQLARRLADRLR